MAAFAIEKEVWALLALVYLMLAILPLRWRVLGAANRLRAQGIVVPIDARDLEGDAARVVFREAHGTLQWNHGSKQVAAVMEQVVDAVNARRPSLGASAALAGAWILSLILAVMTLAQMVVPRHRPMDSWRLAPQPFNLRLRPPRLLAPEPSAPTPADEPPRGE